MAFIGHYFFEVTMEKLLLVLICILGVVVMVKGLVSRFQYRLKATRCSLQTSGKIIDIKQTEAFIYTMTVQYYAEGKFIERKPSITYFQMKYFKNNTNITIDYDPTSCDTFIIEEDLFPIRLTNFLIFSGFTLVCCAAIFIM